VGDYLCGLVQVEKAVGISVGKVNRVKESVAEAVDLPEAPKKDILLEHRVRESLCGSCGAL